jgi:hypothetical protein
MSFINHDEALIAEDEQLLPVTNFLIGVAFSAMPRVPVSRASELSLDVSVVPSPSSQNVQHNRFRMSADGTPISIKAFQMAAPVSGSGEQLDLTLVDPSQRDFIRSANLFLFEISQVDLSTGDDNWLPLFADATLSSSQLSIGWSNGAASDELSITTLAPLSNRLNKAPQTDLVIYDPLRMEMSAKQDPLVDTNGTTYPEEIMPVAQFNLHKLFQILVNRTGFAGFKTNLPKSPIRSATFGMKTGFWDGVKPHIGQFDELHFEKDNYLWIIDSTISLPLGFPAPRDLWIDRYKTLSITEQKVNLDGFTIQYSESDSDPDSGYFVTRTEPDDVQESGSWFDETYTKTITKRTLRDYKANPDSTVVQKTELWKEQTIVKNRSGKKISETNLEREFDFFGREIGATKTIKNLVPDVPTSTDLILKEVKKEVYTVQYAPHPFQAGKQYIRQTVRSISGLIGIDSTNKYLDLDFEQDFVEAHRTGSIRSDFTTKTGGIKKVTTINTPQPNGYVQTETRSEDLVRNLTFRSDNEAKTGDIAIGNKTTRQRELLVLETASSVKGDGLTPELPIAELDLFLAIPLVRRKIKRAKAGELELAVAFSGVDLTIRRGTVLNLKERNGDSLGCFLVEGYSIAGSRLGSSEQKVDTSLNVRFIGYFGESEPAEPDLVETGIIYDLAGNPLSSAALHIESAESKTIQIQLLGETGKKLIAQAVDLEVYAIPDDVMDPDVDLIETGLSLTDFDGELKTITIRIDAPFTTAILDKTLVFKVVSE